MRISALFRAASVALALLALPFAAPIAKAQTVTQLPQFVAPHAVFDLGNGPTEVRMLTGNMAVATSQNSSVGQTAGGTSSTTLTLTATPTTVPCVGCIISGTAITSGTTVSSYSGVTIGLSAAMSVATGTTVSYGAACPANQPTIPVALVQAAVGADLPFYTQARVCGYGANGPGGQFVQFAIGAH